MSQTAPSPHAAGNSPGVPTSPSAALLAIPGILAVTLGAMIFVPTIRSDPALVLTFVGVSLVLLAWTGLEVILVRRGGRRLSVQRVIRTPHWIQMVAQGTVLVWWGIYVQTVQAYAPLILAQIVAAYAVDMLLNWSRRDDYRFGVGPIPVVFSINLFLWFRPEWFYFQFAMVALVFLGKEFLRWTRDRRNTHIFNPSAFALSVAAAVLILTGSSEITFGEFIATTQYNPPHMYLVIFLAALPGQFLFGVATMTASAMVTVYLFSAAYLAATGTFFFYDSYIPIAVFLGMHLLFTDPATSPRSELGRVLFGIFYGAGVVLSAIGLEAIGEPTFWDKLLPVPILNLLVMRIDGLAAGIRSRFPESWNPLRGLQGRREYAATTMTWVVIFTAMSLTQGVGDENPGQYYPFWREACSEGSDRGCDRMGFLLFNYCERGSGWACNELGVYRAEVTMDRTAAAREFGASCSLGFEPGCVNEGVVVSGTNDWARGEPSLDELPIVIRGSKGPVTETSPGALYALACDRGWTEFCGRSDSP